MVPTSVPQTTIMTEHEMERATSEISPSRARADPSACIDALDPLLNTSEGRKFLSTQEGEKALVLIELFDWALKSRGIPLNKGCILWTLRQLCAHRETLPKSCILSIEFKSSDPYHAAGGFADVWKGTYDGREVAFKSIRGSTLSDDAARLKRKRRFCKEVVLWKSLNHPNILGLIGVCRWDDTPDARLTMVSEWMTNGNITEYIKYNESQRMRLLIDCAQGVQYLHGVNLAHGDLKGANILITSDKPVRACLADFGFMTIAYDDSSGPGTTSALGGGTTPFMAPELLAPSKFKKPRCQVSKEADVYAFGMVILQVLTGLMPFRSLRDTEISYKVIQGDRPAMPANASEFGISDGLSQLLAKCWSEDISKRPHINEVLQHLTQEPALGLIFSPSNLPLAPSFESIYESGTHEYAGVFVTASMRTPIEECPPFPMPLSPTDSAEHSSHETRNLTGLFSAETQGSSLVTSPEKSQIGTEEPKPPAPVTPSWTISNRSDSFTIVADSADDLAALEHGQGQGRVSSPLLRGLGPSQHDYDKNHHDPTFYDAPHVDLTQVSAQGAARPSSHRPGPSGVKPTLSKILTTTQLKSRNSDSPGTAFHTPDGSGEVVDRRPFDSAVNIRVMYSGPSPRSQDVVSRRVVDVHQPENKRLESKYLFPIQPLEPPRRNPKTTDVESRHGLRISLTRPSRNTRERRGDSAFSFSSSPFDEFLRDTGSSGCISGVNTSTAPGPESGSRPGSGLTDLGERGGSGGNKETILPRQKRKRVVPKWDGVDGRREEEHEEIGEERDDGSYVSASTDYVPISNEVGEHSRDQDSAQHPSSFIRQLFARLRKKTSTASATAVMTGSADTSTVNSAQDRRRTLSRLSSFANLQLGSTRARKNGNKRNVEASS